MSRQENDRGGCSQQSPRAQEHLKLSAFYINLHQAWCRVVPIENKFIERNGIHFRIAIAVYAARKATVGARKAKFPGA